MSTRRAELVLTGERLKRRHLILLNGERVWLPSGLFAALCRLVHARCTTQTGYTLESPLTIFRLRDSLGRKRAGARAPSLIDTGDGEEYRLAVDRRCLRAAPSVAELPAPELLSMEEKRTLLHLVAARKPEIVLKSL